jgi:hypothetical protein
MEYRVQRFINGMKEVFPEELEFVFYRGYCYWFALILAERFKGDIWFNPKIVHFATKIGNNLYDIYGKVSPGICPVNGKEDYSENDWISWTDFQLNHQEAVESIVNSCIKKFTY